MFSLFALAAALTGLALAPWLHWAWALARPPLAAPGWLWAALALEVLAATALTHGLLRGAGRPAGAARWVVGLAGIAAAVGLTRLAARPYLTPDLFRAGPALLSLATPAGPPLAAGLLAWWRGLQVGRAPLGYDTISRVFWDGVAGFAALLAANSLFPSLASAALFPAVFAYFALGLAALALSSLRRLRLESRTVTVATLRLNRFWLLTAAGSIAAILAAGLGLMRVLDPAALAAFEAGLGRVSAALAYGFGLVIAPIALLAERLLRPLFPFLTNFLADLAEGFRRVLGLARGLFGLLLRLLALPLPRLLTPEGFAELVQSPLVQAGSRWGLTALLAVAAGLVSALLLRRFAGLPVSSADEQRDSIFSHQLLWAQLQRVWQRRRSPAPAQPPYLALGGAPDDARLIVRRSYQAMLEWASALRLPRLAGQTPHVYGEALAGIVPEGQAAIATLTHTYMLARYAADAPTLEEARHAEQAWLQLRALRLPTPTGPGARPGG
ncbi:MAG: DUF4129 domain-containing protein [Anaerolineales bacterium]|nr:DUF4129 domain-containing protein [Anaerolineales bacterium]